MKNIEQIAKSVRSKKDFILFLEVLITDLNENLNEWENKTLPDYLGAMQSWSEDMEGYYLNNNLEVPQDVNWKVVTDILMAARVYE
jgi:hypothetical protein